MRPLVYYCTTVLKQKNEYYKYKSNLIESTFSDQTFATLTGLKPYSLYKIEISGILKGSISPTVAQGVLSSKKLDRLLKSFKMYLLNKRPLYPLTHTHTHTHTRIIDTVVL